MQSPVDQGRQPWVCGLLQRQNKMKTGVEERQFIERQQVTATGLALQLSWIQLSPRCGQETHLGIAEFVGEDGDTVHRPTALKMQLKLLWCARVVDVAHVY